MCLSVVTAFGASGDKISDSVVDSTVTDSQVVGAHNKGTVVNGDYASTELKNIKIGGGNSTVDSDVSVITGDNNATAQGGSAVAHGGEGGNANASVGDNTNLNCNENDASVELNQSYEDKLQGVGVQLPWHLWSAPTAEETWFWNQLGFAPFVLEKMKWSRESVVSNIKHTGVWGAEWGFGVEVKNYPSSYEATDELEFFKVDYKENITEDDWDEIFNKNEVMKPINVTVSEKFTLYEAISFAVKKALDNGAIGVVLTAKGLNSNTNAESLGIGGTQVESDRDSVSTGLLSFSGANVKKTGEPGAILLPFISKKIADAKAIKEAAKKPSVSPLKIVGGIVSAPFKLVGAIFSGGEKAESETSKAETPEPINEVVKVAETEEPVFEDAAILATDIK